MSGLILLTVVLLWAERCDRGFVPNIATNRAVYPRRDKPSYASANRRGAFMTRAASSLSLMWGDPACVK